MFGSILSWVRISAAYFVQPPTLFSPWAGSESDLPKGYTDPANANKSWPLLMTLTGRETCGASFYWYT